MAPRNVRGAGDAGDRPPGERAEGATSAEAVERARHAEVVAAPLKARVAELEGENERLAGAVAALEAEAAELGREKARLEAGNADLAQATTLLEAERAELLAELDRLRADRALVQDVAVAATFPPAAKAVPAKGRDVPLDAGGRLVAATLGLRAGDLLRVREYPDRLVAVTRDGRKFVIGQGAA